MIFLGDEDHPPSHGRLWIRAVDSMAQQGFEAMGAVDRDAVNQQGVIVCGTMAVGVWAAADSVATDDHRGACGCNATGSGVAQQRLLVGGIGVLAGGVAAADHQEAW